MTEESAQTPILEARDIVMEFPGVRALDGVSFEVYPGEIHALVGENGAGKSTLIKILSGVYPSGSFKGGILFNEKPVRLFSTRDSEELGIAVIHQELALVKHITVGENIFLGNEICHYGIVDYDLMFSESEKIIAKLGVTLDVRSEVVNLGVGMQQLVEVAKAMRKQCRVLILDEPTAALAEHEVNILLDIVKELKAGGAAVIYISHKIEEVFQIADRITVLRDGKTVATDPAGSWNREKVVRAMVGRDLTDMFPVVEHTPGDVALEVRNLSMEDPEVPGRTLLQDISFSVHEGEILGIAGLMGAGRTELISCIFGIAPARWEGAIRIRGKEVVIRNPADAIKAGMALVPEDRKQKGLCLILSVLENLSMVHLDEFCTGGIVDAQGEIHSCQKAVGELGIKTPSLDTIAETLSGGNQQKMALGKWLLSAPKILFLDEPTRGIDVGAKAEIHRLIGELTAKGMAVVMVSSELPEILGASDRILVIREGRLTGEFSRSEATQEKIMEVAM
ncbi:ATP-binding cassette domain-containing protein [Candidatus Sumerlaeota bacterium]|nr:ATP-binding cassette domain-containing protein [Candidatus Sumerlaeota bacterium]